MKGYIHSVETFGAVDGPGVRYVVFMQGCFLRCLYCHNPDSWKIKAGKKMSVTQVVNGIKPYLNYISSGGVTISGGEPLLQHRFVYSLIKRLHKLNIKVAVDTAGSLPLKISKKVINASDMLLLDIKALNNQLNKTLTGVENFNTLNTLEYCEKINKPVWIRHVVVPNYTLNFEELENLAKFLSNFKCVKRVELLPFHKMGEYKWKELGIDYKLYSTKEPTNAEMEKANKIFKKYNLIK